MADRDLKKKLKRKTKKKQRRELREAIEKNGHHSKEKNGKGKR